jgi:hypothetical protein
MGTNIVIELLLLVLFVTSVINCQKRIQQGLSWAFHTSIILSVIIGGSSIFMLIVLANFTKDQEGNFIDYSSIVFWLIILTIAILNLLTVKKIKITELHVTVNPLIGRKIKNNFCDALYFTIIRKQQNHCSWKELTIFFQSQKIRISSIQHQEFVDIHNLLIVSGIHEEIDN